MNKEITYIFYTVLFTTFHKPRHNLLIFLMLDISQSSTIAIIHSAILGIFTKSKSIYKQWGLLLD